MSDTEFTAVGKSIQREDGVEKVTGQAEYAYDVELPNMLWGSFVPSPYSHAKIKNIDTSNAEEYPGVHAVLTQADFPDVRFGDGVLDETVLADDRVLFEGQHVAVVAAETQEIADEAAQLVDVEYEQLPAIIDGEEAFEKDPSVVVHPDLYEYETSEVLPPTYVEDRPNVYQHYEVRDGDVEDGFEQADRVYEDEYRTSPVDHVCMEPHVSVARPEGKGELTIWTSCQAVHKIKNVTAYILDKSPNDLRLIEPYVGGGFGGKESPLLEPIVAKIAELTKRPAKIVHTREEEFKNGMISGEFKTTIKTGVTDDGDIVARQIEAICPGGGYTSTGFMVARNATFAAANSYSIPHLKVDTYGVYTNTPVAGSYRGFGNRQLMFPIESQLDDIARDLGLDPIEFRKRNVLEEGEVTAFNEKRDYVQSEKCLDVAEQKVGETPRWETERESDEWVTGTGVALVNKHSIAPTAASAIVKIHADETIELRYSSDEIGQGNTTAMAQIVAEDFGLPVENVKIVRADTDITPFDQGSIASRSTFNMGNAVQLACEDAKQELFEHASEVMEIPPEELETDEGDIFPSGDPDHSIEFKDVFTSAIYESGYFMKKGGEIIGKDTWYVEAGDPEPGKIGRVNSFYSEGVDIAHVSVNKETGRLNIDKLTAIFDVGKAINPKLVEEQIRGALAMGVGVTLFEELEFDPETGRTINSNYSDYMVPTIHEIPMDIESVILEENYDEGPYGAKGIGEPPISGLSPAVSNAILDATDRRIREIPMTPERIHYLLHS